MATKTNGPAAPTKQQAPGPKGAGAAPNGMTMARPHYQSFSQQGSGAFQGIGQTAEALPIDPNTGKPHDPWAYPGELQYGDPVFNAERDSMVPELNQRLDANQMDQRGLNRFREDALRTGPSQWNLQAKAAQDYQALASRDRGAHQRAGAYAQATGRINRAGGSTAAQRAMLARQSMRDQINSNQDISRQQAINGMQIDMNDEAQRVSMLRELPGMDRQAADFDLSKTALWGQGRQFDIGNQLAEGNNRKNFDLEKHKAQMGVWAANRQAQATERSKKKGLFG